MKRATAKKTASIAGAAMAALPRGRRLSFRGGPGEEIAGERQRRQQKVAW
jgi:hypothetical protein